MRTLTLTADGQYFLTKGAAFPGTVELIDPIRCNRVPAVAGPGVRHLTVAVGAAAAPGDGFTVVQESNGATVTTVTAGQTAYLVFTPGGHWQLMPEAFAAAARG